MLWSRVTRWTIAASTVSLASSQYSGWIKNQVNTSMCLWQNPRVAVLQDTAYIDGGWLSWTPGLADGTLGDTIVDGNPFGNIYLLNFSKPFNTSGNASEAFGLLQKSSNGNALNNLAPNYYDGALLANNDEFFYYGGLLTKTSANPATPGADQLFGYREDQYGPEKARFDVGFFQPDLPNTLTRYLAYGGAANVPSENKAFYFGGFHSPLWGELYVQSSNASVSATEAADTLITLDLTTQLAEAWTNTTLPDEIKGRGGVELVWVPVGSQGILVALGGVTYPDFSSSNLTSSNSAQSEIDSPPFMSTIDIYDIAGAKWYKQSTVDGPSQLALGCAVVATAQDSSSYNIYYYGGYDGIHQVQPFNDAVWILSLPSFTWTQVLPGTSDHARAGHRCVKPYPDQMIVIGGYPSLEGTGPSCVSDGVLQVFNLSEAKWIDKYDPQIYSDYGVPAVIQTKIGGNEKGAATLTTPSPSGWETPNLGKVFETKYDTSKITTYYPYGTNTTTDVRPVISSGSGVPSWLAPVLGVVLGLVFITAIVVAILLYRRRKLLRSGASDGQTDENGNRILSWLGGQDRSHKAQTVTSEEPSNAVDDFESRVGGQTPHLAQPEMVQAPREQVPEMSDTALYEMMDTSPRAELENTGLSPVEIINKHSHFATSRHPRSAGTPTNPSSYSNFSGSHDHVSISTNSQSRANFAISDAGRPDSPPLGNVHAAAPSVTSDTSHQHPEDSRIVSGISALSQRDIAHLRNISDASVSTASGVAAPVTPIIGSAIPATPPGPVSPPSPRIGQEDYFQSVGGTLNSSAGAAASPLRRSVFVENQDDLGGEKHKEP